MEKDILEIRNAEYLGDFRIRFFFSDGNLKDISFKDFLCSAKNPATSKFLDEEKFKNFKLEYGDIIWGDYDMCFPIYDLYSGKI